jgi:tetratricopeptide (TPR) repeat protein
MRFALNKMTVEEGSDMLKLYLPWADGEKLRKLAAITGGIPLAMKLAATNIELQDDPETALETQLQKAELASLSDAPSAGVAPEIDTVGEALKLNYNTLTPEEQVAFRTMGALPQALPFDLNVLAAIWQADEAKTRAYCEKLQKLSLLDSDKEFGMPGWFRLQPLLHEYAHNLLQQTGELEETFKRLINFIVPLAKNYETLAPQNWRQLDPYLPQILAASNIMRKQITDRLAQLSEEEKAQLWQDQEIRSALYLVLDFTFSFSSYLQIRPNQYKEDWLNVGLETSRILGDKVKEVHFLNSLGMYYYTQSDKQKAEEFFISALEFANQIGDKKGQATSLNNLGLVYAGSNRFEEALNYYNQALEVYHKLENPLGVASTFVDLAVISETLENYEEALTGYREARKIYADLDAKYSEADVCYKMGELLWKMDQAKEALELMETSQKLFQEINSPHAENLVQVIADMKAQI